MENKIVVRERAKIYYICRHFTPTRFHMFPPTTNLLPYFNSIKIFKKNFEFSNLKLYNYKTNLRTSKGHSATKPITHPHKEEPSSTTRPRYPRGRSPWENPSNLFVVASVGYLRDSGLCMQRGPRAILHWLPRALTNAQCKCTCAVWLKGFVLISGGVFEWGFRV